MSEVETTTTVFALLHEVENVRAALVKLNKTATRLGLPHFTMQELPPVRKTGNDGRKTRVFVPCIISGEPLRIAGGWQMMGSIAHLTDTEQVVFGKAGNVQFPVSSKRCDHCGTKAGRKRQAILVNDAGEWMVVGHSCLKFYSGALNVFKLHSAVNKELGRYMTDPEERPLIGGGAYYELKDVVQLTIGLVEQHGFFPVSSERATTMNVDAGLATVYYPSGNNHPAKHARRLQALSILRDERIAAKAAELLQEWASWHDTPGSFRQNVGSVARAGYTTPRMLALIVGAAGVATTKAQHAEQVAGSEWVGQVGQRMTVRAKLTGLRSINTAYGPMRIYKLISETGGVLTWKTSKIAIPANLMGQWLDVNFTVKSHTEYKGAKETNVLRLVWHERA